MFSLITEFSLMHRLQGSKTNKKEILKKKKYLYLCKIAVVKAAFAEGIVAADK